MSTRVWIYLSVIILSALFFSFTSPVQAAVTHNLSTTSEFNVRIDGPDSQTTGIGVDEGMTFADLNNNGYDDVIFSAISADNNSRTNSGSVYIIYDSILRSYAGTGNTIDLADSSKWNIRIDGSAANESFGSTQVTTGDIDADGKLDLFIGASNADFNSRNNSGSVYVIKNTVLSGYSSTGNTIDMSTSSNFSIRIDGPSASQTIGSLATVIGDVNGNGGQDLVISGYQLDNNSRTNSGSSFIFFDSLLSTLTGTGNTVDLATTSNFNVRLDGPVASSMFGFNRQTIADANNDGKDDFITHAITSYNSLSFSGSVYVFFSTLLDDYSGTGNLVDTATTSKFSLRIDGPITNSAIGILGQDLADVNSNGINDFILTSSASEALFILFDNHFATLTGTGNNIVLTSTSNYNFKLSDTVGGTVLFGAVGFGTVDMNNDGRADLQSGGSTSANRRYIIYSTNLDSYSGTGNDINIVTSNFFNTMYTTSDSTTVFGYNELFLHGDVDNDGSTDFAITDSSADYNSRSNSGSVWIIYNFPHTITLSNVVPEPNSAFPLTGSVSASNSVTNISGVEFQVDSNSPTGTWTACTASDGSFNSTSEAFSCTIPGQSAGNHTVNVRAYDTNTSYTAQSSYGTWSQNISFPPPPPANISGGENTTAPAPAISSTSGGTVTGGPDTTIIVEPGAIGFSSNVSHNSYPAYNPPIGTITPFGGIGEIHQIWLTDFYNGARIIPSVQRRPSIVSLSYNHFQLLKSGGGSIPERTFRLAYSLDGKKWTVLRSSVVDPINNTVSAITKVGGYYMIVSGYSYAPPVKAKKVLSATTEVSPIPKAIVNNSPILKDIEPVRVKPQTVFEKIKSSLGKILN